VVRAGRRLLQPAIDTALIILAFYLAGSRYRLRLFAGVDPAFSAVRPRSVRRRRRDAAASCGGRRLPPRRAG
jgi:hypothetical protein